MAAPGMPDLPGLQDLQVEPDPLQARLDALQAAGAPQREPARLHIAAALARRRAGQAGAVRQRLDTRLAALLDDLQQRLAAPAPGAVAPPPAPGPLALLCAELAPVTSCSAELRSVQQFGATWARLRIDAQLRRASQHQHRQRGQAGPLNSQRLMLQALQQLRRLSPAYLQRFMAQAETLLWLDDAGAAAAPVPAPAPVLPRPAPGPSRRSGTSAAAPAAPRRRAATRRAAR